MRVYLPSTLPELAAALDAGELTAEIGYAVTPALREWYIEGDLEELEYAATTAAARASLRLLRDAAEGGESPPRRLVVAAELADGAVRPAPDVGRAAVRLGAPVPTRQIVSAHVDDAAAEDDVRRALAALAEADAGDEDAQFLLDQVEDHELAWFAAQELGLLVELES